MRRRPGIQGIQRTAQARDHFKALGKDVAATRLEHMQAQMASFKENLEEFALKHREDIRKDPAFRAQFHTMCANIGVDPLASNKGVWAQVLGFGDFYYELGVQIVEACLATRPLNGGLMEMKPLMRFVNRRRGSKAEPITEDDVIRAIDKLKVLGGGFSIMKVGQQMLVRSVPGELNTDKNEVLRLAQGRGFISKKQLIEENKWQEARVVETLWSLLKEGIAMADDQGPGGQRLYWFPCLEASGATQAEVL
ncbi:hypothetical protein CVIRNUC_000843 [Coccomyxa viridis]|uniref:Vacuolar protein sorting-associated protein n=1 Tax=Coccomyxa viridis TaxID=1274662 RepID=A0AAV1HRF3_9CHLO|nr:hypothetical protein CVIRNUC_000843 [Coccomyxa viridis]